MAVTKLKSFRVFLIRGTELPLFRPIYGDMSVYYQSLLEKINSLEKAYTELFTNPRMYSSGDCNDFTDISVESRRKCNYITKQWVQLRAEYLFILQKLAEFKNAKTVKDIQKFLGKNKGVVTLPKKTKTPKIENMEKIIEEYIAKDNELRRCLHENRQLKRELLSRW